VFSTSRRQLNVLPVFAVKTVQLYGQSTQHDPWRERGAMNIPLWAALAILTSLLWAIVNILDKVILYRYNINPWIYLGLDGLVGVISLIIILVGWSGEIFANPQRAIVLALLSGLAVATFNVLYFYALRVSAVTIIIIFVQITPIFSLFWGLTLLGERYGLLSYAGMFLILSGAVVAGLSGKNPTFNDGRQRKTVGALLLMLLATFSLSLAYLLSDVALKSVSVVSVFFWQRLSLFLISIPIFIVQRQKIRKISKSPVLFTSLVEIINILAFLSIIAAYAQGPLVVITFLSSLQPMWVLILTWIIDTTKLRLFSETEEFSRVRLILACAFVILGIYFIRAT